MAIGQRAAGTWGFGSGSGSFQVTIPGAGSYQVGDLGLLFIVHKPFNVTTTVDQSWQELIDETPGSTNNGNGAGSVRLGVYYKVFTSTSETDPTVTWSGSYSPAGEVIIVLSKGAGETWDIAKLANSVEQAMGSSAMSHGLTTTTAVQDGDWIFALTGVADESATFTRASDAISGGGVTYNGNVVEYPSTHGSDTSGNDAAADVIYRAVTTGVASGATITVTATLSNAERVGSVLFRVGVDAAGTNATVSDLADAAGTANVAAASVAPTGGHATATGAALTPGTGRTAGIATGTGEAHGGAGSIASSGGVASATGAAGGPSPALATTAGHATAAGAALDATVSTAVQTNAPAELATSTGDALQPSVSVAPTGAVAQGTGTAHGIAASVATGPGAASATGAAGGPTPALATTAGHATAAASALDATVSTAVEDEAPAELATATATANQPSVSVFVNAGLATAIAAAWGVNPSVAVNADLPAATATAHDATTDGVVVVAPEEPLGGGYYPRARPQRVVPKVEVRAGHATATGRAYGARVVTNDDEHVLGLLLGVSDDALLGIL